jgi:hypothetical protein
MSALTPREQALYNLARATLPRILFSDDDSPEEVLAAFSKQFAAVMDEIEVWVQNTFITTASTLGLDIHAKDRGTRRQSDESNEGLVYRLRFLLEDSVTVAGIVAKATGVLNSYGVTIPANYPGIVQLRQDRAFYGGGDGIQIVCPAAASIVDGETFTIAGLVYEMDKNASYTAPNTWVNLIAATTAATVATAVALALQEKYGVLATSTGDTVVIRKAKGAFSDTVANAGFTMTRQKSYYSCGYRMTGASRAGTVIVVMLPYGTTETCRLSVAEAMRQAKAGGVKVIVERRLNP